MPIAPRQEDPDMSSYERSLPRQASGAETPVPSPVHRLQAEIAALGDMQDFVNDDKLPGWVRASVPIGASILLWSGIAWMAGLIG